MAAMMTPKVMLLHSNLSAMASLRTNIKTMKPLEILKFPDDF